MSEGTGKQETTFLILHERDNTVTALKDLVKGEEIMLDPGGESGRVTLRQNISYAHKFARTLIPKGDEVIKYGEVIGVATADIQKGDHVHVHNVESKRARGDLA